MLAKEGIQFQERDFFKRPFTGQELRALLASLNLKPREVLSTSSPSFRALSLGPEQLSEEQILNMMVEEPRLMRRPLIVVEGRPFTLKRGHLVEFTSDN